jgi:uncharacterized protein
MPIGMFLCIVFLWIGGAVHAASDFSPKGGIAHPIDWYEWGEKAFREAQAKDKLILLDLTAVWCHACHVMDETTYADREIVAMVNASFVPVRVDTDQHPDVAMRYRAGGWPTTSVLLPTGEILFQANALSPAEMTELLQEFSHLYPQYKQDFRKQADYLWQKLHASGDFPDSGQVVHPRMVDQTVAFMKERFDARYGGFRAAPKFFEPDAVHMALVLGFVRQDSHLTDMGLKTLVGQEALLDPVWGGFYRYAEQEDWTAPHYEKMLTIQAENLQNYLEAFQLTGDAVFRQTAEAVIDYVREFLTDPTGTQFWESQDADLRSPNGMTLLSGAEYFALNEKERYRKGVPFVDRRVFTGSNALMAEALVTAAWVLGRTDLQATGLEVIRRLADERWNAGNGILHSLEAGEVSVFGLLSDHIQLGKALTLAYQYTHEKEFFLRAKELADNTRDLLEDPTSGGFFDRPLEGSTLGLLNMPIKPPGENLQAVLWYLDLFDLTHNQEYRLVAERTLNAVVSGATPLPIALMGKAVDRWVRGSVHVAVIGSKVDPMTMALLKKSIQLYYPGKLVRLFDVENEQPTWGEVSFPYDGRSVAFACTDKICSPPVFSPDAFETAMLEVISVLDGPA